MQRMMLRVATTMYDGLRPTAHLGMLALALDVDAWTRGQLLGALAKTGRWMEAFKLCLEGKFDGVHAPSRLFHLIVALVVWRLCGASLQAPLAAASLYNLKQVGMLLPVRDVWASFVGGMDSHSCRIGGRPLTAYGVDVTQRGIALHCMLMILVGNSSAEKGARQLNPRVSPQSVFLFTSSRCYCLAKAIYYCSQPENKLEQVSTHRYGYSCFVP